MTPMKTVTYEGHAGESIVHACCEAVRLAKRNQCEVAFDFNEQHLVATPQSDPVEMAAGYSAECERRHATYLASPEYKAAQAERERKDKEREACVSALLTDAPKHMTLRDADGWQKSCDANPDGYGGAVMTYAERWARLMEARLAKGEKLADIAEDCSHLANSEGITGFMYGCAVSILAKVWQHGEALRLWHNLKTQLRNEGERANATGGLLNPALLTTKAP